jgi:hypothetical protein
MEFYLEDAEGCQVRSVVPFRNLRHGRGLAVRLAQNERIR